jgi:glycosyltransferase 2 family protein
MTDCNSPSSEQTSSPEKVFEGFGHGKLIAGGVLFVALTLGIFWYLFQALEPGKETPRFDQLRWIYLLLCIPFLPVETLLSSFRMWLICRVLQPEISFKTCLKADLANSGVAVLTPSQTGGGPGQIYMLNRGGAKLGTALTISLLTFFGTMIALCGMGFYTLFRIKIDQAGPLFLGAVAILTLIAALILFSAALPGFFRATISGISRFLWRLGGRRKPLQDWWKPGHPPTQPPSDRMAPWAVWLTKILYNYQEDLRRFLRDGKLVFFCSCLISLGFFFSRFILAFLCVRFLGIEESSLGEIILIQMTLVFLTYLAPTPGSAGIAELASLTIMAGIVPHGFAPYYNLLWRFTTVYLVAAIGLFLFLGTVLIDMGNIYRQRKEKS